MLRQLNVVTLFLVFVLGCGRERAQDSAGSDDPWLASIAGPSYGLQVTEVATEGEINARSFGAAVTGEAFHDPGLTTVTTRYDAGAPENSVMAVLYFEGGLDHPALVPGAIFEHTTEPAWNGELSVSMVGCQGLASAAAFGFGVPARHGRVTVGPRSDAHQVELLFEATFESDGDRVDTLTGAIVVERPSL